MSTALTLFEIEDRYLALVNSEECVSPEMEQEFRTELSVALQSAVAKRDKVAQFLLACKQHEGAIDAEIKRLQALKKSWQAGRERMEKYVVSVIEGLGTDAKGKHHPLKGEISILSVRRNPVHVEITDPEAVPQQFKTVTVCMSADAWARIVALPYENEIGEITSVYDAATDLKTDIDKRAIKTAIEAGLEVRGADLGFGELSLQVK